VIRVATLNLHRLGEAPRDDDDVDALGTLIASLDADVLGLQEICSDASLDGLLARTPGGYLWRRGGAPVGLRHDALGVALVWRGGRTPSEVVAIPGPGRRCLAARMGGTWFVTAHFVAGWPDPLDPAASAVRRAQAQAVADWGIGRQLILLGDLNAPRAAACPDEVDLAASLDPLRSAGWTWPAASPDLRGGGGATMWTRGRVVDHMMWSPHFVAVDGPRVVAFDVVGGVDPVRTTDHRPVVATLDVRRARRRGTRS
jgi:endonuclease/exonuclease/phosphatase family metal-dependent hydrolase